MIKKIIFTFGLTFLLSATTQALPIAQADAFSAGDNNAVLETSTGLIWMDFGINSHQSYAEVTSLLSTDYLGWRLPTAAEVTHLWGGLFGHLPEWHQWSPSFGALSVGGNQYDDYFAWIYTVFGFSPVDFLYQDYDEFGNLVDSWTAKSANGVFMKEPGVSGLVFLNVPYDEYRYRGAMYLEMNNTDISNWYNTLLVKDSKTSVPEPSCLMLGLLALMALFARRQRTIK